jgi:hypothetical protein
MITDEGTYFNPFRQQAASGLIGWGVLGTGYSSWCHLRRIHWDGSLTAFSRASLPRRAA